MYDENSEASFVLNGVFEFIKVWQSGNKSRLTLHSKNGKAWINFNCCLGGPLDQHKKIVPKSKPKSKSKKKQERDNLRAQLYQQRLQDKNSSSKSCNGSLNLQLSSLSSNNESVMEVESSPSIRTAASSSPKNGIPTSETKTVKSSISDSSAKSKNADAATVINEHTAVVTPINSIDWDKEVRSKIEEWRKMDKEFTYAELPDFHSLFNEYIQNVKERLEASDESFDDWREKYGGHLLVKRRFWITAEDWATGAFSPF